MNRPFPLIVAGERPRRKRTMAAEESLHRTVSAWLDTVSGGGETFLFWHTPNGAGRSRAEAGVLKAMGVRAGIPDILILADGRLYAIEIKAPGGSLSKAQIATMGSMNAHGTRVAVATSLDMVDHLVADVWRLPMRCRPRIGEGPDNWRSIGEIAAAVVRKARRG